MAEENKVGLFATTTNPVCRDIPDKAPRVTVAMRTRARGMTTFRSHPGFDDQPKDQEQRGGAASKHHQDPPPPARIATRVDE